MRACSSRRRSIADLTNDDPLVAEEQFGPALPIIRYSDVDEAIAAGQRHPDNGLGGSVWSRISQAPRRLARRMQCGSVWINKHGAIQPNAPFGGVKSSGVGVEFGEEGLANTPTSKSCSADQWAKAGARASFAHATEVLAPATFTTCFRAVTPLFFLGHTWEDRECAGRLRGLRLLMNAFSP